DGERLPHVHPSRLNSLPLVSVQLATKELVPGFFSFQAEPERLRSFQIADHGDESYLFPQKDFVYAHLMQRGLFAVRIPAFQDAQIDGSHRALRHAESLGYAPRRSALASLAYGLFKAFGKRHFARQPIHFFDLQAALWTA